MISRKSFFDKKNTIKIFIYLCLILILSSCESSNKQITIDISMWQNLEDSDNNMLYFNKLDNTHILIVNQFEPFLSVYSYQKNKFCLESKFGNKGFGPREFQYITALFKSSPIFWCKLTQC